MLRVGIESVIDFVVVDPGGGIVQAGLQAEEIPDGVGVFAAVEAAVAGRDRKSVVVRDLVDKLGDAVAFFFRRLEFILRRHVAVEQLVVDFAPECPVDRFEVIETHFGFLFFLAMAIDAIAIQERLDWRVRFGGVGGNRQDRDQQQWEDPTHVR